MLIIDIQVIVNDKFPFAFADNVGIRYACDFPCDLLVGYKGAVLQVSGNVAGPTRYNVIWIELLFAIEAYLDAPAEFADEYVLHAVERLFNELVHEINAYQSDNPRHADELVNPVPFPVNSVDLDAEITDDFGF